MGRPPDRGDVPVPDPDGAARGSSPSAPTRPGPGGPPTRPEVAAERFTASGPPPVPPAAVSAALSVWIASLVAGVLGAGTVLRSRADLEERLAAAVRDSDPGAGDEVVRDAAEIAALTLLGGLAAVLLVHLLLLLAVRSRVRWARAALVLLGPVGAGVVLLAQDVVARPDVAVIADVARLALLAQVLAALVGSGLLLSPSVGRWLRAGRRPRRSRRARPRTP